MRFTDFLRDSATFIVSGTLVLLYGGRTTILFIIGLSLFYGIAAILLTHGLLFEIKYRRNKAAQLNVARIQLLSLIPAEIRANICDYAKNIPIKYQNYELGAYSIPAGDKYIPQSSGVKMKWTTSSANQKKIKELDVLFPDNEKSIYYRLSILGETDKGLMGASLCSGKVKSKLHLEYLLWKYNRVNLKKNYTLFPLPPFKDD